MFLLAEKAKAARTGSTGVFFLFCFFFLRFVTNYYATARYRACKYGDVYYTVNVNSETEPFQSSNVTTSPRTPVSRN